MKDNPVVYVVARIYPDYAGDEAVDIAAVFYEEAEADRFCDKRPFEYYRVTRIQTR